MARIAGVDLPNNKRGEIGLTYIFGIGPYLYLRYRSQLCEEDPLPAGYRF